MEKVHLFLPSTRSSFDKTYTRFACYILLYALLFPILGEQ